MRRFNENIFDGIEHVNLGEPILLQPHSRVIKEVESERRTLVHRLLDRHGIEYRVMSGRPVWSRLIISFRCPVGNHRRPDFIAEDLRLENNIIVTAVDDNISIYVGDSNMVKYSTDQDARLGEREAEEEVLEAALEIVAGIIKGYQYQLPRKVTKTRTPGYYITNACEYGGLDPVTRVLWYI